VEEYGTVRQATDDIIWPMGFACRINKVKKHNQNIENVLISNGNNSLANTP